MQKKSIPLFLALLLPFVILAALNLGPMQISFSEIFERNGILFSLRLPRVLLAAFVGAALGISGAAIQGLFRNPLAEPGLIGILAGATLAVAFMIVAGNHLPAELKIYATFIAAFFGGLLACILVFRFAALAGNSVATMLLSGIAINAVAFACVNFLIYGSNDQQMRSLNFWLMGSLGGALWSSLLACILITLPAIFALLRQSKQLNIMLLGQEEAHHLGVDAKKLKRNITICVALCAAASVAAAGPIAFIGLMVPHLIRLLAGGDNRIVFPASALLGAILLVSADTVARNIIAPAELPVGILTALIGGPYFLWLMYRQNSSGF